LVVPAAYCRSGAIIRAGRPDVKRSSATPMLPDLDEFFADIEELRRAAMDYGPLSVKYIDRKIDYSHRTPLRSNLGSFADGFFSACSPLIRNSPF
jgi:hypothetical protein